MIIAHIPTTVYNLQTEVPHTYIAAGIAVHNKGGGGGGRGGFHSGHGGGSSCSPGDTACNVISWSFVVGFMLVWSYLFFYRGMYLGRGGNSGDLDYLNSRSNIEAKSVKTKRLIQFLAKQDEAMDPATLTNRVRDVFTKLQSCWMQRDYTPMKDLLMSDLYAQHCCQIQGLIRDHEINKLNSVQINNIDLVNVRYTEASNQRVFTALISATAADYYVDDRTEKIIRGSTAPASFQEFWTFQFTTDGWRLRDIEQARESDYLKTENFVEMFTDLQIQKIYQGSVDNMGASGPALPASVEQKANKVDRMINFLYQSNKMWDRDAMLTRVRSVFTQVHMAFEAGKLDDATAANLFPDVAAEMRDNLTNWEAKGYSIEYRNFCVRKVELVLVNSYDDASKNDFTARITAHAQNMFTQNGKIISQDADVTPFVEFWEFGCLDNQWKLKDAKPESDKDIISAENTEEGSSPNLVKWYYTKKRAL